MKNGKLIVITGSSGVGKTTIANAVQPLLQNVERIITYTTRQKRPEEINGRDYNFISKQEFLNKIKHDFFLEWAIVFDEYYGNSLAAVKKAMNSGRIIILVVDIQGAKTIKNKLPEANVIFLRHESVNQLRQRLLKRPTTTAKNLKTRIKQAEDELKEASAIADYQIVNKEGKIDETVSQVKQIIAKQ